MNNIKPTIVYCDQLAHIIKQALQKERGVAICVQHVGPVEYDLHPDGSLRSTTKRIAVTDQYDTNYVITIAEKIDMPKTLHEHELTMLRHELAACETALKQERQARALEK